MQLDLSGNQLCGVNESCQGYYTAEGITAIADALRVNGALTSVKLRGNKLRDEGWGAIFAAICGNKDSKIMSLDASFENIGPAGVKLIAEALRTSITGALTVTNLLGNQLDAESAKMLAEVAKQKGISLCGIQRDQTTAHFSRTGLEPPDAILLGSDLSQAVVTGGLTSINLSGNNLTHYGKDMTGIKELVAALGVNGGLTSLNLSSNQLCGLDSRGRGTYTAEGITAIADAMCVNGALTVTNLLGNQLDAESAKMLAEVAKQKGISLCGIRRDQTTADFRNKYLEPADAILLASDLSQAVVTGGLTALDLSSSDLNDEGVSAVCEAILSNKEIELASFKMVMNRIGPVGAKSVAAMVAVTGVLTKLSLARNNLGEEGTKAICEALEQNKTLKELDLSGGFLSNSNIGGAAGAKHVAKMLGVNGGLTALDLSFNELKDEGVSAVCEAILSNKETKLASLSMVETRIGPVGAKSVAAMVAVTGALTSLDLSNNSLCEVNAYRGTYAAEGITAIADALCVNGALTECNLKCNPCIGEEGEALIRKAMQGKAGLKLRI